MIKGGIHHLPKIKSMVLILSCNGAYHSANPWVAHGSPGCSISSYNDDDVDTIYNHIIHIPIDHP